MRVPRAGGDEPTDSIPAIEIHAVFPAQAGMNRLTVRRDDRGFACSPRRRG